MFLLKDLLLYCIRYSSRNKHQRGRGQRGRRRKFHDRRKGRGNSPSDQSHIKNKHNNKSSMESTFKGDPLSMLASGGDSNNSDGKCFWRPCNILKIQNLS